MRLITIADGPIEKHILGKLPHVLGPGLKRLRLSPYSIPKILVILLVCAFIKFDLTPNGCLLNDVIVIFRRSLDLGGDQPTADDRFPLDDVNTVHGGEGWDTHLIACLNFYNCLGDVGRIFEVTRIDEGPRDGDDLAHGQRLIDRDFIVHIILVFCHESPAYKGPGEWNLNPMKRCYFGSYCFPIASQ